MRIRVGARLMLAGLGFFGPASAGCAKPPPLEVRVVVVTAFEIGKDAGDRAGEFQNWVEKLPLGQKIPAPLNLHAYYRYNPDLHVLGLIAGEGHSSAAQSTTALLTDPRFDLRHAYFLLAGIAGINPNRGTLGSAVWARYIVNGGLAHMIDPREMPKDWQDPYFPVQANGPYPVKRPVVHSSQGDMAYALDKAFVGWAFRKTRKIKLSDGAALRKARSVYAGYPAALASPRVMLGDTMSSETFWNGVRMNDWAQRWVSYWTDRKGVFVTTAMEDLAFMLAVDRAGHAGLVDPKRVLVLRTGSNFDMPPPGTAPAELFSGGGGDEEGYAGLEAAVSSAYKVGSVVVRELAGHWDKYRDQLPR